MTSPALLHALLRGLQPLALAAACLAAGLANPAHAGLVARDLDGNGATAEAYHDTTLGITWMRDTRYRGTLGAAAGPVGYASAQAVVAAFNADMAGNYGYTGWRLPQAGGVHTIGGPGCQFGAAGNTDCGDNVDVASSELAHLFHVDLGNRSWRDTSGQSRPGVAGVDWGLVNSGDFEIDAAGYWTSTTSYRLIFNVQQTGQVVFNAATGTQAVNAPSAAHGIWLVHDGDIGNPLASGPALAVVVPGSLSLAALGLVLVAARRRR